MTKADLEEKRADYQRQIEALQVQAHQLSGAIADCDHWLAELAKRELPPSADPEVT